MVHTSTFVATAEVWDFLITRLGYKGEDVKKAALVYGEAHKGKAGTMTQLTILKNMETILREHGAQPRA